jgi:hypothetical protein
VSGSELVTTETPLPHAHTSALALSFTVHVTAAATILTLYAANPSLTTPVSAVTFTLQAPAAAGAAGLSAVALSPYEPAAPARGNGNGYFLAPLGSIPAHTTASFCVTITGASASWFSSAAAPALLFTVGFTPGNAGAVAAVKATAAVPVPVATLLRPTPLLTKQYAEAWKRLGTAGEAKLPARPAPAAVASAEGVAAALARVRLHAVQTIAAAAGKQETIAAGELVGPAGTADPVLVHLRLTEAGVAVHVRTTGPLLAAAIAAAVADAATA